MICTLSANKYQEKCLVQVECGGIMSSSSVVLVQSPITD